MLEKANLLAFLYISAHSPASSCSYRTSPLILIWRTLSLRVTTQTLWPPRFLACFKAGGVRQATHPVRNIPRRLHCNLPIDCPSSSYKTMTLNFLNLRWELTSIPWWEVWRSCFTVHSKLEQYPHSGVQQSHVGYCSEKWRFNRYRSRENVPN